MMATAINFDAVYRVEGMAGVAWRIYPLVERGECEGHPDDTGIGDPDDFHSGETFYCDGTCREDETSSDRVIGVMVGDDAKHEIDVDDLIEIKDEDYCHVCGQLGCTHDGR